MAIARIIVVVVVVVVVVIVAVACELCLDVGSTAVSNVCSSSEDIRTSFSTKKVSVVFLSLTYYCHHCMNPQN